jgi:hypothetical protein
MRYIILLILVTVTACSSSKPIKEKELKKKYNPTQKYFKRKIENKKTQLA